MFFPAVVVFQIWLWSALRAQSGPSMVARGGQPPQALARSGGRGRLKVRGRAQVTITGGLDGDQTFTVPNHPSDPAKGERPLVFTKVPALSPPAPPRLSEAVSPRTFRLPYTHTQFVRIRGEGGGNLASLPSLRIH
jgi:hypothetical protein